MKPINHIITSLLLIFALKCFSQGTTYSSLYKPINIFDKFGNEKTLDQLKILNPGQNPVPGGYAAPITSCSAGYFNIYFAANCGMDGSSQVEIDRRAVVCQVFSDLAQFINSPLTGTNTCNILIETTTVSILSSSVSGVLGVASPYHAEFFNSNNLVSGLIPGEVWKTIKLGKSSYVNTAPFSNSINYSPNAYHGYMAFNFDNPGIDWDISLTTNTITSTQFDFYTNVLHEAMHMLGLASYIDNTGASIFGSLKRYYSYYDSFLTNSSGSYLITNGGNSCSKYYHNFSSAATQSNLASCVGCASTCSSTYIPDNTNCSLANNFAGSTYTVPVYTPACFESGSSLSHFEDMCYPPYLNNLYFVNTNGVPTGSGSKKRYPKAEERSALCDLGYNVNGTYNSPANGANFNYGVSACSGKDIAGANDGLNSANVVTLTCAVNTSIQVSGINVNDRNATNGYVCLETLLPATGNLSNNSGSSSTPFTYTPTTSGLHVLRYLPVNSLGQQGNITYVFIYATPNNSCNSVCNKVSGGDFEVTINTPPFEGYINYACGWANANGGSCDYYTTAVTLNAGIPCNWRGYELNSITGGTAYAGFACYYTSVPNTSFSFNEILYSALTTPLTPNTAYKLTFNVSNADVMSSESYSLQVYFSPDLTFLSSNAYNININNPAMLFTTPYTFTTTNGWQQAVIDFTTGATTNNEQYIVIGNLQNNPGTPKTPAPAITGTCNHGSNSQGAYYYIDNVTLTSNSITAAFNLQGTCTNQSVALNSLATPTGGVFTGSLVTNNSGNYVFNAGQNASIGTYNIAYTYTVANCQYTIHKQIQVGPTHTVSVAASNVVICANLSQNSTTLTASSSTTGVTYNWQPVSSTVNPIVVSPTVTTIYTVTGSNQGCNNSATIAITVNTACCTDTNIPMYNGSIVPSINFDNPMAFNNDITIAPGANVNIRYSEFIFAPYVKITVKTGAVLHIDGAHLRSCQNEMWNGIVLEDGAILKMYKGGFATNDNLIEDAITAIHVPNHATSTYTAWGALLDIKETIFNKNHVSILISDYQRDLVNYPFLIHSCVFTSRTLTYTANSWPNTSTTGSGLRATSSATNGLQVPYQMQGTTTNLKAPYNTQPSHIGILMENVGITNGTTYRSIQIGSTANVNQYNVFDSHGVGILANTTNLRSLNNVFQNTQRYTYPPLSPWTYGGDGINQGNSNNFNSEINLTANSTNPAFGNRFYNCHRAVNGDKVYKFDCKYATIRSTQTSTNTSFGQGNTGIVINTNRFNYVISNNNIANVGTGINILVNPSTYTYSSGSGYGVYAWQLLIQNNYIGSQTTTAASVTTQYVDNAINLSSSVGGSFHVGASTFGVITNTLNRVLRGVNINGMSKTNHAANTGTNVITLLNDNVFNSTQHAIKYTNNASGTVRGNTISAVNTTNTLVTLFYAGNCTNNPTVACNNLSNSWQAFEFNSSNSNVFWRGNKMSTHNRGLVLNNVGIIGTQGSSGNPSDNEWNNSWASSFGTYIGAGSAAQNSLIWYRSLGGIYAPPTPSGVVAPGQFYGTPGTLSLTTGSYNCGGSPPPPPPSSNMVLSNSSLSMNSTNLSEEENYILQYANYSHVKNDVSLSSLNQSYISSNINSSIDKMYQLNELYYSGNFTPANSLNSTISPTNTVEQNYKTFYNLYSKFSIGNFTTSDESSLELLTKLCPGLNGTVIYQSRALRNYIHKTVFNYNDMCEEQKLSARENSVNGIGEQKNILLQVDLYPNPANNFVTLVSTNDKEVLSINITDVNGKTLLNEKTITEKFTAQLNFNLQNGIYFVEIINDKNERTIKKLVISK